MSKILCKFNANVWQVDSTVCPQNKTKQQQQQQTNKQMKQAFGIKVSNIPVWVTKEQLSLVSFGGLFRFYAYAQKKVQNLIWGSFAVLHTCVAIYAMSDLFTKNYFS